MYLGSLNTLVQIAKCRLHLLKCPKKGDVKKKPCLRSDIKYGTNPYIAVYLLRKKKKNEKKKEKRSSDTLRHSGMTVFHKNRV